MRELTDLCGSCEGCTEGHCTFRDADIEELIRPAVTVPDWAREEADIAPDAKLDCHVDEGSGVITVCETFYDHDLSDIPAELLEALRKSGCCLSVLEDMLMDDDVIYDIRRLTPLECERLQGFPDGWTDIPGASDSARYKALGNSVAIPCVEFIMSRIAAALL